jgi:hypothetical protein
VVFQLRNASSPYPMKTFSSAIRLTSTFKTRFNRARDSCSEFARSEASSEDKTVVSSICLPTSPLFDRLESLHERKPPVFTL